jgi:hypothetical protein
MTRHIVIGMGETSGHWLARDFGNRLRDQEMERENLLLERAGGREVLLLQSWITTYGGSIGE